MSPRTASRPFVDLLSKTSYSFMHGASHPEEMIQTAKSLGYQGLGIVDHQGFYGMVRAYKASRQLLFTVFYGVEISLESASIAVLARSFDGYKRICRFLSEAYQGSSKGQPKITRELLKRWIDPQLMHSFLLPRKFPSPDLLRYLMDITPLTQFVTHLQHPDRDRPLAEWLQKLPTEIPKIWTWDAHFHSPERFELYEMLESIRTNTPLHQKASFPNSGIFLHPLSDLEKWKIPAAWTDHALALAASCNFSPQQIKYEYPQEWLPKGKTSFEFLKELCQKGLQTRYSQGASPQVHKQLAHELQIVQELEFSDYFLTVWDIVQFARSQNILCQGRGSAANSIVCYLLEVTAIDPVRMNLLFERFISRERNEAPDIDVDFEHERREEVIQYLYRKYGRERAGMVATLITFRTKSSLREVGKSLGAPPEVIHQISQRLSWRESATEIFESLPWAQQNPVLAQRWQRLSSLLKGFPRHLGQHTGGMILTQGRLDELSPIEPATMDDRSVIQWDKYDIETLGLLKVDILSLGMLTCLRKTFDLLKTFHGISLELHTIPADDPLTFEMIGKAQTMGVFQIESRAQMSMLPRLKPKNFYDLVVEVAIVRPGPIQGGMVHPYLRRRMGLEKVTYAHPKLRPILEKTLGVPIFQEQVMKMAIEVAGYSPGEADELRRAMGAWKKSGNLEKYAADMSRRMIEQGIPADFSQQVCQQILGFGEYGFPESHAASFALLTYASAYLKAHHPEAFVCGLLNSMPLGFYSLHTITSSFQKESLRFWPIHTEFSDWDHKLEKSENGEVGVRLGFRIVTGLSQRNFEKFFKARAQGQLDLYLFDQDERSAIALATEQIHRRLKYWQALEPSPDPLWKKSTEPQVSFPSLNPLESIFLDLEVTQTTILQHPTQVLKRSHWNYRMPLSQIQVAAELKNTPRSTVNVFGIVQTLQSPPTARGMTFITLEDETGFLNLVLRPHVFKKYRPLIRTQWGLLVSGKLQNQSGSISILVQHIHSPQPARAQINDVYPRDKSRAGSHQGLPVEGADQYPGSNSSMWSKTHSEDFQKTSEEA